MKIKKTILGTLAVLGSILLLAGCGQSKQSSASTDYKAGLVTPQKLTVGLEGTFPPYSYSDHGKLNGFEVELGKDIAKKLGLQPVFVPTKWDSLIAGLGSNKFDVVLNDISVTPQREKVYAFAKPYIYSRFVLISCKGDDSLKSLKDIKGKKIVAGTGTNNQAVAQKWGADIVPEGDFATAVGLIKQGRAQGEINSREAFLAYAKENSASGLQYTDLSNEVAPAPAAPLLNKKSTALVKKINQAISELRTDGTLTKLSDKYFGSDITK